VAISAESISASGGLAGYFARPERASAGLPGILVLQEAWGLDAHIEDVTRRFAAAGYAAFAPDLFAEADGKRPAPLSRERLAELVGFINGAPPTVWSDPEVRAAELAKRPEAERGRLAEAQAAVSAQVGSPEKQAAFLPKLLAATAYLRQRSETRGQKVGSVGFCMGGALSALLACHDPELGAAVIFYGSAPPVDALGGIRCPVRGFYGGKDARIIGGLPAFMEAMRAAGKDFEPRVYPEAGHAFFNDGRPAYDLAAARDAFARTLAFFGDQLVSPTSAG
jgi:carboxymethylenebutenolidase